MEADGFRPIGELEHARGHRLIALAVVALIVLILVLAGRVRVIDAVVVLLFAVFVLYLVGVLR